MIKNTTLKIRNSVMTDWLTDWLTKRTNEPTNLPINQPAKEHHKTGREFPQLVKKFPTFMYPEVKLTCSEQTAICPCSRLDYSIPCLFSLFL